MKKGFKNTGPLAAQVGLLPGKRWRCPICSLCNTFDKDACPRCTEPVSEEEKLQYQTRPSEVKKQHVPLHLARPNQKKKKAQAEVEIRANNPKPKRSQPTASTSMKKKSKTTASRTKPATSTRKKKASTTSTGKSKSVRGFNSKGKTKNMSMKSKPNKKLNKPAHKMDPKHLGYKATTKGNVSSGTRSKLNYDTASYRAKFSHNAKPLGGKKMNIATLEHIVSKQGFNTAVKTMKNGWDKHADRPVTPPGKRKKGRKGPSWITALQQASSTGAVASLRHKEKFHHARQLDIDGKKSKFAL